MNDVIERITSNGYTASIFYDSDCSSPRDDEGNFLFLGFPHRSYKIGDEELDPSDSFPCPACGGSGFTDEDEHFGCPKCEQDGIVYAQNLNELIELVTIKYKANLVLPVGMIDHGNVAYYIGGGAHPCDPGGWDSGTCGLILDTPESLEVRGHPDPITDEWLRECMVAEISEYSKWAGGECYGYVITDRNGEEVDSCWGFIGSEYVEQEVKRQLTDLPEQPPKLHDVRLTSMEIDSILAHLSPDSTDVVIQSIASKLEAIDTSEEDE